MMSTLTTSTATLSATSSPGSADGPTQLDLLAGLTIAPSGQGHAHVSPSARPANGPGFRMKGTFGPSGENLSPSDVLQMSLESKLQTRLHGSGWCGVIWSKWVTPWGQSRSRPRARAVSSSATAIGLWPAVRSGMTGAPSVRRASDKNPNLEVIFSREMIAAGREELLDGSYLTPAFLLSLMRFPTEWDDTAP